MLVPQFSKATSLSAAAFLSLLLFDGAQGQAPAALNNTHGLSGFPPCDALISANLSHAVHLPSSPLYPSLLAGYWSLNTRKSPWCFVSPSSASEVSRIVTTLHSAGNGAGDWHIAIRSGGHASDDSNNIANGVTIDLSQMNGTVYDTSKGIAHVGGGSRWQQVYDSLAKYGVGVTGGREGVVGVGGFLLGGGNSFYTARQGFACDNVVNYEIVLASGAIINANKSSHSDLWRALRGGGSNFGIVTRFDLRTFPVTNQTMETRVIGIQHADEIVDAFVNFTDLDRSFHDNAMLTIVTYTPTAGGFSVAVIEVNTMNDANTTAFDGFNRIPTLIPTTRDSFSLPVSANRTTVPENTRNAGSTLTIANDPRVLHYALDQHAGLVAQLNRTLAPHDFTTILEFQPLPSYFADVSAEKGGNMLGFERRSRNKILIVGGVTLTGADSEAQYAGVNLLVTAMTERIEAFSRSVGSDEPFRYLNYAHANEDPIGSYGPANVGHIRRAAKKYDPKGFFQSRVPGGFKIDRVA